jgi:hypothetical protein
VLRPVVGRISPFAQTPEALQALGNGGLRGKAVIINPPGDISTRAGAEAVGQRQLEDPA